MSLLDENLLLYLLLITHVEQYNKNITNLWKTESLYFGTRQ